MFQSISPSPKSKLSFIEKVSLHEIHLERMDTDEMRHINKVSADLRKEEKRAQKNMLKLKAYILKKKELV